MALSSSLATNISTKSFKRVCPIVFLEKLLAILGVEKAGSHDEDDTGTVSNNTN